MILFSKDKISPKWKVNKDDLKRMFRNALIFISPAVLIYLSQVQGELSNLSFESFKPNAMTIGAIWAWFLSIVIDFFRKLSDGK